MPTAIVTSRGRVTIPAEVRTVMRLRAGQRVAFVAFQGGFRLVPLTGTPVLRGGRFAGRVAKAVTLAAMDATMAVG
jgi:antitoxin PrlF